MRHMALAGIKLAYGGLVVISSTTTHPKDQISAFVVAPFSSRTSGAM